MNITSGGVARTYLRRIPAGYDATEPAPVVFAIHGWQEGAQVHTSMSEWAQRADANGFVVIYPQGLGSPVGWNTTLGSADLAYIGHVLDQVEADLCLDRRRVFAAGLSMGAFMSSSIACQYAGRFAAVALVAGIRNPSGCAREPGGSRRDVPRHRRHMGPLRPDPGHHRRLGGPQQVLTDTE